MFNSTGNNLIALCKSRRFVPLQANPSHCCNYLYYEHLATGWSINKLNSILAFSSIIFFSGRYLWTFGSFIKFLYVWMVTMLTISIRSYFVIWILLFFIASVRIDEWIGFPRSRKRILLLSGLSWCYYYRLKYGRRLIYFWINVWISEMPGLWQFCSFDVIAFATWLLIVIKC